MQIILESLESNHISNVDTKIASLFACWESENIDGTIPLVSLSSMPVFSLAIMYSTQTQHVASS